MLRIINTVTKVTYDIEVKKGGENQMLCPVCSENRKPENRKKKVFYWNDEKKTGYCQHCNSSFVEYKPFKQEKEYKIPVWKNITSLTDKAVKYFTGRMISQSTLNEMKIYSDNEYMPQLIKETEVICFPYFNSDSVINIKYRGANKSFKLYKDAELIFYNFNVIANYDEIIITEGEIDCLSFIEIGCKNCISVPNGASGKNLEYLDNYIELFDGKNIILATDNDPKGIELRQELLRRFGQERCKIVNFKEYKDANEVLCKEGGTALQDCLKNSIELPVEGVLNINNQYDEIYDLYINGLKPGKTIGYSELDRYITYETGRVLIITGIPGHGKSEFLDYVLTKLNIMHGWKVGYFSPENYPVKYHYAKIASKLTGVDFNSNVMPSDTFESCFNYVSDNFFWVYPEQDMSIENILEKAKYLVKKKGIKVFVVDPYNKLEHTKNRSESETEYISRFLDIISNFAKRNDVLFCLVAHPRKIDKLPSKKFDIPTLYDISGSANFYNKTDYGVTVYRHFGDKESPDNHIEIHIQKVKFRHLGETGLVDMKYNYKNGRFENINSTIDNWDYRNYLSNTVSNQIEPDKEFWTEPLQNEIPF